MIKKPGLDLLILLFCLLQRVQTSLAQSQAWGWVKKAGSPGVGEVDDARMCTVATGNIYSTGLFAGSLTFSSHTVQQPWGMFLTKHNPAGDAIWAVSFAQAYPFDIYADSAGNSYVTGQFSNYLNFGPIALYSHGSVDMFVAKFDSTGNVLWARRGGGPGVNSFIVEIDRGTAIGVDAAGNCYVGGIYTMFNTDSASFDSIYLPPDPADWVNRYGFIAKYDIPGNLQWVKSIQGYSADAVRDIAVAGSGDVVVFGMGHPHFPGSGISVDSTKSVYYACFKPGGSLSWANGFGVAADETFPSAIAVSKQNEYFLLGTFEDTLFVGADTLVNSSLSDAIFLAKANPDGTMDWVRRTYGTGGIGDCFLVQDSLNNFYTSCFFSGQVQAGSFTTTWPRGVIAIKWTSNGDPVWVIEARGTFSTSKGIALSPDLSTCYVAGIFEGYKYFGNTIISNVDYLAYFLAELKTNVVSVLEDVTGDHLTIYPNPLHGRHLQVQLPGQAQVQIQLTSVEGKVVYSGNRVANSTEIELPQLPAGTYILSVQTTEKVHRQKVIVL